MTKGEVEQLFSYTSWANALMLRAAEALPTEQFEATVASSFPSVGASLGHIVGAEWIWLRRWLGESPPAPGWAGKPKLAELKAQLAAVEAERSRYLNGLSEADLDRLVSYRNLAGQEYANRLSDLIRHVVNHSTYHRGQVATQLRQLGQTPPNTDFVRYVREKG